jgi:hypothetical protein
VSVGCRTCGSLNPVGSAFCQYCGASLPQVPAPADPFRIAPRPAPPDPGALAPAKDPSTGLLIEMLPGFFGFLGIGHLWAGDIALGLGLLIGYWCFWAIVGVLTVLMLGLLLCFLPLFGALYFAAPIFSGLLLQKRLRQRQALVANVYYPVPY